MSESTRSKSESKPKSRILCVKLLSAVRTGLRAGGLMGTVSQQSSDQQNAQTIGTQIQSDAQAQAPSHYTIAPYRPNLST